MERDKVLGFLYDEEGELIKDNWIVPDDIIKFVKEELDNVMEENLKLVNSDIVLDRLKSVGIPIIELLSSYNSRELISLKNLSEFIKYLEITRPPVVFYYAKTVTYSDENVDDEEEVPIFLYTSVEKEFEKLGILKEIYKIVKQFLDKHTVMSQEIEIFDGNRVGVHCSTESNVIDKLSNNLNYIGEKLEQQKDFLEELNFEEAKKEIKSLYSYLIINGDFLNCKTEKQFKIYKDKQDYLKDDRFKKLQVIMKNKPNANTTEYAKHRDLYVAFEDAFEKSKRFVKYGEQ